MPRIDTYDNLTAEDIEDTDELVVWDGSATAVKNVPVSELSSLIVDEAHIALYNRDPGSPGELWTPAELDEAVDGLARWFDASDSDTLTLSGVELAEWADKTQTSPMTVVQGTPVNRPTVENTVNSLNVVSFDEASAQFLASNTPITDDYVTGDITVIAVSSGTKFGQGVDGGQSGNWGMFFQGDQFTVTTVSGGAYSTAAPDPGLIPADAFRLRTYQWEAGVAVRTIIDGTVYETATTRYSIRTDTDGLQIGRAGGTTGGSTGDIGEILIFNTLPSTTVRQKCEGYLAWKWGLEANLPSGHPYENVAPTTTPLWTPSKLSVAPTHWYDADDATTITTSGDDVTSWGNKGSAAGSATRTEGVSAPHLEVAGLGGKNTVSFDGSNDYMDLPATISASANGACYVVMTRPSAGTISIPLGNNISPGTSGPYPFLLWTDDIFYSAWGSSFNTHPAASPNSGSLLAASINTSNSIQLRQFGANSGSPQNPLNNLGDLSFIGRRFGDYHDGDIAEIVYLDYAPTLAETELIEGYLAHKWGLEANLPIGHPYKYVAPLEDNPVVLRSKLLPAGGSVDDVLTRVGEDDYDVGWTTPRKIETGTALPDPAGYSEGDIFLLTD